LHRVIFKEEREMDLKNEFAKWFPPKSPEGYRAWFRNNLDDKLNEINDAYKASFEKSLFDIDITNISKEISNIKNNIINRHNAKDKTFAEYDLRTSNGIPKAIISNYYIGFLLEKYNGKLFISRAPKGTNSTYKSNTKKRNSRYKGNPIGNSQNGLIRNILSNLGEESFNENDWEETKKYFNNKCAYCGTEGVLVIEHAIPINKEKLGEHKIGNIVPACKNCNQNKADKDYKEFLGDKSSAINKIEQYMKIKNYIPLGDNEQIKYLLDRAHEEAGLIAERYINIINELFIQK
jgi:5-methylcytosine-specific restriction endonuclease McrA